MPKKPKPRRSNKNPFVAFDSVDDVFEAERKFYIIQIGKDIFAHKGRASFDRRSTEAHYNRILSEIIDMINTGNAKQRYYARRALQNFRILPLRIH